MNTKELGTLLLLGALWGGSYLFIRVAVPELGPALLIDLRVLVAGVALVLYATAVKGIPSLRPLWKRFLALGAINAAIPFTLIAFAEIYVTASLAAVLIAATPLFTALVSAVWLGERITAQKVVGLLMGVVGVAVIVGLGPVPLKRVVVFSMAALLLAAFFYSVGAVYVKKTFEGTPPLTLATGQQLAAGAILLLPTVATLPDEPPSGATILAVASLALLSTALAYILYFFLIASAGPTKTLLVTFLAPAFGVIWGVLFLGEDVTFGMLLGLGIVFSSVVLVAGIRIGPAKGGQR